MFWGGHWISEELSQKGLKINIFIDNVELIKAIENIKKNRDIKRINIDYARLCVEMIRKLTEDKRKLEILLIGLPVVIDDLLLDGNYNKSLLLISSLISKINIFLYDSTGEQQDEEKSFMDSLKRSLSRIFVVKTTKKEVYNKLLSSLRYKYEERYKYEDMLLTDMLFKSIFSNKTRYRANVYAKLFERNKDKIPGYYSTIVIDLKKQLRDFSINIIVPGSLTLSPIIKERIDEKMLDIYEGKDVDYTSIIYTRTNAILFGIIDGLVYPNELDVPELAIIRVPLELISK